MDKKENTRVLVFVYGGYIMRYLYLLVVIPFYGRVLGVTEYGRVLAAMSLMNVIWMLVSYGFTFVGMRDVSRAHEKHEYNGIFSLHLSARILLGAAVEDADERDQIVPLWQRVLREVSPDRVEPTFASSAEQGSGRNPYVRGLTVPDSGR